MKNDKLTKKWTAHSFRRRIDRKMGRRPSETSSKQDKKDARRIHAHAQQHRFEAQERLEGQLPSNDGKRRFRESQRRSRILPLRPVPGAFPALEEECVLGNAQVLVDEEAPPTQNTMRDNDKDRSVVIGGEYDPNVKKPIGFKNTIARRYYKIASLLLVLVALTMGLVVGLIPKSRSDESMPAPTFAPTSHKDWLYGGLLANTVGAAVQTPGTPEARALQWIIHEDPMQLPLHASNLIQRFTLALLYFQTTDMGSRPWKQCQPVVHATDESCLFHVLPEEEEHPFPAMRWLSSADECEWGGISCTGHGTVEELAMTFQGITGTLPTAFEFLTDLEDLTVADNNFTGTIPDDYMEWGLRTLRLDGNMLTGSLPDSLYAATSFDVFGASENLITGTISSEIGLLTNLEQLDISENLLTGTLSSQVGNLSNIEIFFVVVNGLNQTIPSELGLLSNLAYLGLEDNEFTGRIPTELGMLTNLLALDLNINRLSGALPTELGMLRDLDRLNLGNNSITGTIPEEYYSLTSLEDLELNFMNLTGTISTRIGKLRQLNFLLRGLRLAWFHYNQFAGAVPDILCGNLGPSGQLESLQADCGPEDFPALACSCCSACCNPVIGHCYTIDNTSRDEESKKNSSKICPDDLDRATWDGVRREEKDSCRPVKRPTRMR